MPSIKGTSSVEDSRALSKALKSTKFPSNFYRTVDLSKLNRSVFVQWIETKISESLGFEDEIVQSTAVNLFLPVSSEEGALSAAAAIVDPRRAQIDLAGFLGDEQAAKFASELWDMMLDAASQPMGIPRKLLDEKKKELAAAAAAIVTKQQQWTVPKHPPVIHRQPPHQQQQQQYNPAPRHDRARAADGVRPVSPPLNHRHGGDRQPPPPAFDRRSNQRREDNHFRRESGSRTESNFGDRRIAGGGISDDGCDEYGRYRNGDGGGSNAPRRDAGARRDDHDARHHHRLPPPRSNSEDEYHRHHRRRGHGHDDDTRRYRDDEGRHPVRPRAGDDRYDDRHRASELRRRRSRTPPNPSRRSRRDRSLSSYSSSSSGQSSRSRSRSRDRGAR